MNKSLQKVIETLRTHMNEGQLVWHNPCLIVPQSNLVSKKPYQGMNQCVTALVADRRGYQSPYWATFNQIRGLGGELADAKGQGVPIVFYKNVIAPSEHEDEQNRFILRHSAVFNLDLVRGLDIVQNDFPQGHEAGPSREAEAVAVSYLEREQIPVIHGRPAYIPSRDTIRMPHAEEVTSMDEFFSCYFHEMAHSVGHPRRLCRFGVEPGLFESKDAYSQEELVAEITAAMLCHDCGVDSQASIRNSAAYLQGWSRFIRDEEHAFLCAINQAYKARAFILTAKAGHAG